MYSFITITEGALAITRQNIILTCSQADVCKRLEC